MARPDPTVLLKIKKNKVGSQLEILSCSSVFVVTYRGLPFGIRTANEYTEVNRKYPKTTFTNPGHAFNLAERLNSLSETDQFSVHEVIITQPVVEGEINV